MASFFDADLDPTLHLDPAVKLAKLIINKFKMHIIAIVFDHL